MHARSALCLLIVVLAATAAGCLDELVEAAPDAPEPGWERAYTVVAPVDTGINVYHEHFRSNEALPAWMLEAFGVTMTCDLTFGGDHDSNVAADRATCWDLIEVSDVVHFHGTRIIGTTGPDPGDLDGTPILDDAGHGTAVSGAVVNANPDVILFFVEGFSTGAVLKATGQPLVDVITTSFGHPGSVPLEGIESATREAVVTQGKIHVGAADNSPSPALQDATAGPPWSIGIAGYAEEGSEGKEIMSGSWPDVAADWTQVLPVAGTMDEYGETSGTSFATPRTAGILSHVLQLLRAASDDMGSGARLGQLVNGTLEDVPFSVSNEDVREALNRSAWYPDVGDWNPDVGTLPVNEATGCPEVGWGYVNLSNIEPIVGHLDGTVALPTRPAHIVACMDANQAAREQYWDVRA